MFVLPGLILSMVALIPLPQQADSGVVDHHLHVLSPDLIARWKAVGARFSRPDRDYSDPLVFCKREGIARGFLVSMAHLLTTEPFGVHEDPQRERALVAAENDFVARCVRDGAGRFIGFASVHPLRNWAVDEIDRVRRNGVLRGIKLHLPACEVNLRNKEHQSALARVFRTAAEHGMPLMVHVSGFDSEFSLVDAEEFWERLVKPHPKLHLYLAHIGASGGLNDRSRAMLTGFRRFVSRNPKLSPRRIYFDLSGALLAESVEGVPASTPEQCRELAELMTAIGIERFLFASDYPVFSPREYRTALREKLPLDASDLKKLLTNRSPLFGE